MEKVKKLGIVLLVFSLGLSLQWAWSPVAMSREMTIRMGWFGGPRPWVIGKAKGMFEDGMGAKIKWLQWPSGAAAISALGAGEVDITRLGSSPMVAAIARGVDIYQIAIAGAIARSERLIAKKAIPNIPALEGKKIGYPPGSTAHYTLLAALKVYKVNIAKTKLLSLKPSEMLAAWKRGDIDAAYVWGPFTHQMEADGGHELLATKELRKHGYYTWNNYVVRKEFADKHPDLIVKFLEIFQENVKMYKSDPEKWAKFIADYLNQKYEAAADTLAGLEYPSFEEQLTTKWLGDSKTTEQSNITKAMMDVGLFLVELGDLRKRDLPKSFGKYNNMTFMEKVARRK
ncbi:MAG: ABC transporter substrate-binding protein [Deltaproteobacteria bacterium]|nr:ABC transporter substrate-binding protein [Deltaproteobacteria bacterium]MBW2308662.1 ABC transporter substrate-binding protein [Deltaproteobacteria bacterium]